MITELGVPTWTIMENYVHFMCFDSYMSRLTKSIL